MGKLYYVVKFLDFWHISSGESGGAIYDYLVKKDNNMMPYIPGKTIKGLVRENAEKLGKKEFVNNVLDNSSSFFSNLYIIDKEEIINSSLQPYLFKTLTFTAIDKKGIAKDNTLREIEFVVPVSLEGYIEIEDKYIEELKLILSQIKRMGLNRNRGFGRCNIYFKDEK